MEFSIGTAAWNIPKDFQELFPTEGSHLERYSQILSAVEINSSFYKDHKAQTYARWKLTTPAHFRFAVKLAKEITHGSKLQVSAQAIREKLNPIQELAEKWEVLLIQIPPSLKFDAEVAENFFSELRYLTKIKVAFEPRDVSWLGSKAQKILKTYNISKVIADPPLCQPADVSNFLNDELVYHRLHGSPEVYRSPYEKKQLLKIENELIQYSHNYSKIWCIFDNTTFGFATANAVELNKRLQPQVPSSKIPKSQHFVDSHT